MKSKFSDNPSTAIILYGVMHRSLKHVVANLREFVIKPLSLVGEVDIFFHSWDVRNITNPRSGEYGVEVELCEVERWLPEARGVFESQEEFDATVNWGPLLARNYTRHSTKGEEASQATLMNYVRALESQERAWRYFQKNSEKKYNRVLVTRPDLLFLHELPIPPEWGEHVAYGKDGQAMPSPLYVPRFEASGGVCDRFAMGAEREVGIWCQKAAFADGWLMKAGDVWYENSEWLLLKWLQRNRVELKYIDFIHQRMRANGEVTAQDRHMVNLEPVIRSRQEAEKNGRRTPLAADAMSYPGQEGRQRKAVAGSAQFHDRRSELPEESCDSRVEYRNAIAATESSRWYENELDEWKKCFTYQQPVRAMEIGVADGMSGKHLLGTLFTHDQSELHLVNTDDEGEEDFLEHIKQGGHENQLHLYNGNSAEILAWMIAEEGFWESFDFILQAGETPGEILTDACQSWHLLKPGGLMVFRHRGGKNQWPSKLAADSFVAAFGNRIQLKRNGSTMVLRKL
jgi:hypothetical protein